jgi:hypothetical protein
VSINSYLDWNDLLSAAQENNVARAPCRRVSCTTIEDVIAEAKRKKDKLWQAANLCVRKMKAFQLENGGSFPKDMQSQLIKKIHCQIRYKSCAKSEMACNQFQKWQIRHY